MNGIPNIPAGYMCSETPTQKDEYDYWICDGQLTVCTAGSYCEENNTGAVACPTGKTSQAGAMTLDYCYYSDSVLIDFDSDNTVSEDILKTAEDAVEIQTVEIWEPNVINIQWKDSDGTVL
nr:hypothetical protein [Candidatus Enterousia merdequi]